MYGDEGARMVGTTIIDMAKMSEPLLPKPDLPVYFKFGISLPPGKHNRNQAIHAWANGEENTILVLLNPNYSSKEVCHDLCYAIPHEYAHLAHHQDNPNFDSNTSYELFAGAIAEGIANCASSIIRLGHPGDHMFENAQLCHSLHDELQVLLDTPSGVYDMYDFKYGNVPRLPRAYTVGQYVVWSYLTYNLEVGIANLLEMPLCDFVDFAKSELI